MAKSRRNWIWIGFIIVYSIGMMLMVGPRYANKGGRKRVERDHLNAVKYLRRLQREFCRRHHALDEEVLSKVFGDAVEELHNLPGDDVLIVTAPYVYHVYKAKETITVYPRAYISPPEVTWKENRNDKVAWSFLGDCNFSVYYGDLNGREPDDLGELLPFTE